MYMSISYYCIVYTHTCMYNNIIGLKVTEVAHDIQAQVSKYVIGTLRLVNSYDTWHGTVCMGQRVLLAHIYIHTYIGWYTGTKNVAKEMKKIAEGRVRDREKTWFP